jgi:hypothetical protein
MTIGSKFIDAPLLRNIVEDHDDHPGAAPMRSTGRLALDDWFPEGEVESWFVEYKCDVCGSLVYVYSADLHDEIRQTLVEKGIVKP